LNKCDTLPRTIKATVHNNGSTTLGVRVRGGGVYKMELARKGEGKHGGYRSIVIFKSEFRSFFVYGFPKSKMDNIEDNDLRYYRKQAKERFSLTDEQINEWLKNHTLIEIVQEEEGEI
jgi:hypothetical protein